MKYIRLQEIFLESIQRSVILHYIYALMFVDTPVSNYHVQTLHSRSLQLTEITLKLITVKIILRILTQYLNNFITYINV